MTGLNIFVLVFVVVAAFIGGVLFGRRNKEKVEAGVSKAKEYMDKSKR